MSDIKKVAAIFSNHQSLKTALHSLEAQGLTDISVLVKSEADQTETDARTYSTTAYPDTDLRTTPVSVNENAPLGQRHIEGMAIDSTLHETPYAERGYDRDHVQDIDKSVREETEETATKDPNALIKGSTMGGILGALAGAGALLIPGIGPVLAAGPIATAVAAIAAGGAAGMTVGALVGIFNDEGIPQDRVDFYRNAFESGKAVVIVEPDQEKFSIAQVRELLGAQNPETLDTF